MIHILTKTYLNHIYHSVDFLLFFPFSVTALLTFPQTTNFNTFRHQSSAADLIASAPETYFRSSWASLNKVLKKKRIKTKQRERAHPDKKHRELWMVALCQEIWRVPAIPTITRSPRRVYPSKYELLPRKWMTVAYGMLHAVEPECPFTPWNPQV